MHAWVKVCSLAFAHSPLSIASYLNVTRWGAKFSPKTMRINSLLLWTWTLSCCNQIFNKPNSCQNKEKRIYNNFAHSWWLTIVSHNFASLLPWLWLRLKRLRLPQRVNPRYSFKSWDYLKFIPPKNTELNFVRWGYQTYTMWYVELNITRL